MWVAGSQRSVLNVPLEGGGTSGPCLPQVLLVESVVTGSQVHPASGTEGSGLAAEDMLAAVKELAAVEKLAAVEHLADVEDLADVWDLADVEDQTAVLVPSPEEASGVAGTAHTAQVAGWPHA